jgi:hypothetical protein
MNPTPCGICVSHAVTRGVSYDPADSKTAVIGLEIADGTEIHEAVAVLSGTPVCWYHVSHVNVQLSPQGVSGQMQARMAASQADLDAKRTKRKAADK